jgi:hypothetical protein
VSDDDPYRRGRAAPPALVELAAGAEAKRRELPRDVDRLPSKRDRARQALGIRAAVGLPSVLFGTFGFLFLMAGIEIGAGVAIFGALLLPVGIVIDVLWSKDLRARTAARLAEGERHPFPVKGYEIWLASERPLLDVHLRAAVARDVVDRAATALDPDITIEWFDDRLFRVALPPHPIGAADEHSFGGDPKAWASFADKILAPLHADVGIERVEMGGSMRGLPPGR